jgi:GDP-L-fucose synthase
LHRDSKIYVAGGQTLIGQALLEELESQGYGNLSGRFTDGLELTDPSQVDAYFAATKPEYVFLAAGKSGGIEANQKYPAELMRDNLLTECHILHSALQHRVKKLLYLASSCSYPKHCPQPMKEEYLLTGLLEPTNEAYALAKIAGIRLCQAYHRQYGAPFLCGIPGNAFGPGDDFSEEDSHVIPGLIRRMHEAKQKGDSTFLIWGTGAPRREFIYSRDLAEACILVMKKYEEAEPINLGMGSDISISELAGLLKKIIGFKGELSFDPSRPDGMPVKLLDSGKLRNMNWKPRTSFRKALEETYQWYLQSEESQDRGARFEVRGTKTATGIERLTEDRRPQTAEGQARTRDRRV